MNTDRRGWPSAVAWPSVGPRPRPPFPGPGRDRTIVAQQFIAGWRVLASDAGPRQGSNRRAARGPRTESPWLRLRGPSRDPGDAPRSTPPSSAQSSPGLSARSGQAGSPSRPADPALTRRGGHLSRPRWGRNRPRGHSRNHDRGWGRTQPTVLRSSPPASQRHDEFSPGEGPPLQLHLPPAINAIPHLIPPSPSVSIRVHPW